MGGIGSGRRPGYGGRGTTDDALPLDVRRLQRAGALEPGRSVGWYWSARGREVASIRVLGGVERVTLYYQYSPSGRPEELIRQGVELLQTPGRYGGARRWFACPLCRKRVAVIYGAGRLFGCRTCKGLAYESQREAADSRAIRQADRIRKRLGWPAGILNPPGDKPRGMHWSTFLRLRIEHDEWVQRALQGMARQLRIAWRVVQAPPGDDD